MPRSTFAFKEFAIRQDKCLMKISTDSVLIGAWTNPNGSKNILDIGTGTGIIALMLAQKSKAQIDAIDICPDACTQAKENFENSKWNKRLTVFHSALQNFSPRKKYDLIVSNPPYFDCPSSTHAETAGTQMRYTHKLSFPELLEGVLRLLSLNGKFCAILPVNEASIFTNEAEKNNFYLTRYVWVKTTSRKKFPKRVLMQFQFSKNEVEDEILVLQKDKKFTEEYRNLTQDYYAKF